MAPDVGQLVQIINGVWRGCIGTVSHNGKGVTFVDLYRGGGICVLFNGAIPITVEQATADELPCIYRDAQVAAVDFFLGAKTAALELIMIQVEFLQSKREECENGGYFTDSDRTRYGKIEDSINLGIRNVT